MKRVDELQYQPPDQEVILSSKTIPSVPVTEDAVDNYMPTIVDLINKYDLLAMLCDYCLQLVDKNMDGVQVSFSSSDYPEVFQAHKRRFPTAKEGVITYEQYKLLTGVRTDLVSAGEW